MNPRSSKGGELLFLQQLFCTTEALAHSPDQPASAFGAGDGFAVLTAQNKRQTRRAVRLTPRCRRALKVTPTLPLPSGRVLRGGAKVQRAPLGFSEQPWRLCRPVGSNEGDVNVTQQDGKDSSPSRSKRDWPETTWERSTRAHAGVFIKKRREVREKEAVSSRRNLLSSRLL